MMDPKAFINMQDKYGQTALHRSVTKQEYSRTKTLLENGAVVSVQDKEGDSPLHMAVRSDNLEICRIVVAAQSPSGPDQQEGRTRYACMLQEIRTKFGNIEQIDKPPSRRQYAG